MGVQTSVSAAPPVAYEGQLAEMAGAGVREILTGIVDATNGAVKFGRAVRVLTGPAAGGSPIVELPNATGEVTGDSIFGVVVGEPSLQSDDGTFDGHGAGAVIPVLRKGRIWVKSEDAGATAPAPAYVRFTADTNPLGGFRHDADTDEAVAMPGARFLTTCGAGELVLLEVHLPVS